MRRSYELTRFMPLLEADTGNNSGGDNGDNSSQAATNADTSGGEQGGTKQQTETEPYVKFLDADTFHARMDREAKSRLGAQAKELGFDSVDAMLAAAKTAREQQDAEKTESQRLSEQLTQIQQERDSALDKAETMLKYAAVTSAATKLGFADSDDAWALIDRSTIEIDDGGKVSNVEAALQALLEKKPHLKGQQQTSATSGADFTGSTNQHGAESMSDLIRGAAGRGTV